MPGSRRTPSGNIAPQSHHYDDDDDENLYSHHDDRHDSQDYDYRSHEHDQEGDFEHEQYHDQYDDNERYEQPSNQRQSGGRSQQQYDDYDDEENLNNLVSHSHPQSHHASSSFPSSAASRGGVPSISSQGIRRTPASSSGRRSSDDGRSFITENAKSVIRASKALASSRDESKEAHSTPSIQKHDNFGKVPAYLKEAKADLAAKKAAIEAEQAEKASGIPPGMVLMPEDQRLKTLEVLNESTSQIEERRRANESMHRIRQLLTSSLLWLGFLWFFFPRSQEDHVRDFLLSSSC